MAQSRGTEQIDPRTKCRRIGCGWPYSQHGPDGEGCEAFIGKADVAKRKAASPAEQAYGEAYARGIRRAAPGHPWTLAGARVGSTLGAAARDHARGAEGPLTGAALVAWIEAQAEAFRRDTADAGVYWSGWQPHAFVRWLNTRAGGETKPGLRKAPSALQPGRARKFSG